MLESLKLSWFATRYRLIITQLFKLHLNSRSRAVGQFLQLLINIFKACRRSYIVFEDIFLKVKRLKNIKSLATNKLFEVNLKVLEHSMNKRGSRLQVGMKRVTLIHDASIIEDLNEFDYSSWGIVFQGQLQSSDSASYLKETLEIIRKVLPDITIVLSSYSGQNEDELKRICSEFICHLTLTNDPGTVSPPFTPNVIRQIASSYHGLTLLENFGKTKAIKIRFDQRIARPESLIFVEKIFQIIHNSKNFIEMPILTTSMNSYESIPGFASDMMQFGYLQSMLKYWKLINQADFYTVSESIFDSTASEIKSLSIHPEVWLALRYLRNFDLGFLEPDEFNYKIWSSLIGILDSETVGQEWSKTLPIFVSNYQSAKWLTVSHPERYEELRFYKWFSTFITVK